MRRRTAVIAWFALVVVQIILLRVERFAVAAIAAALASGILVYILYRSTRAQAAARDAAAARLRSEIEPELPETPQREMYVELHSALQLAAQQIGARRAVLWEVDAAGNAALPLAASSGRMPEPVRLYGDALRWVWSEGTSLRVSEPASWARDAAAACACSLKPRGSGPALVSFEFDDPGLLPADDRLQQCIVFLQALLATYERQRELLAMRSRFDRVLDLLQALPRDLDANTFAENLATAVVQLTGATGAAVGVWVDDHGEVLCFDASDGRVPERASFTDTDSEMGLAIRAGTTLYRTDRRSQSPRPAVASTDERWAVEPRSVLALPLRDLEQSLVGALAVWSPERDHFDREVIAVLEAVLPYAAQQLQHAKRFGTLRVAAEQDVLTGLLNRRAFEMRFAEEVARYDRYGHPFSVCMLDLDHFKRVNDTFGHEAGDEVLRAVGRMLAASLRTSDAAARYGGEELILLLPETSLESACDLAERLRAAVEKVVVTHDGNRIPVTASFGVSTCPVCVTDPAALVPSADAALYEAKKAGRNRVRSAPAAARAP